MDTRKGRFSHAYIIASASEELRNARAESLAAAMVCEKGALEPCGQCRGCRKALGGIHPDIISVTRPADDKGRPRREIYVDQVRDIVADAYILPNEAVRKVYVIKDAGFMNRGAQNTMLKLLEEPPAHAAFVLCTENAGLLLDTVRSRCVEQEINAAPETENAEAMTLAARYLELVAKKDRAELLRFCMSEEKQSQAQALDFLSCAERLITDMLGTRSPHTEPDRELLFELAQLVKRSRDYLSLNVSVKHVFGMLAVRTLN